MENTFRCNFNNKRIFVLENDYTKVCFRDISICNCRTTFPNKLLGVDDIYSLSYLLEIKNKASGKIDSFKIEDSRILIEMFVYFYDIYEKKVLDVKKDIYSSSMSLFKSNVVSTNGAFDCFSLSKTCFSGLANLDLWIKNDRDNYHYFFNFLNAKNIESLVKNIHFVFNYLLLKNNDLNKFKLGFLTRNKKAICVNGKISHLEIDKKSPFENRVKKERFNVGDIVDVSYIVDKNIEEGLGDKAIEKLFSLVIDEIKFHSVIVSDKHGKIVKKEFDFNLIENIEKSLLC